MTRTAQLYPSNDHDSLTRHVATAKERKEKKKRKKEEENRQQDHQQRETREKRGKEETLVQGNRASGNGTIYPTVPTIQPSAELWLRLFSGIIDVSEWNTGQPVASNHRRKYQSKER